MKFSALLILFLKACIVVLKGLKIKEVWWSEGVRVPASRSQIPDSNLGPGPPHSVI